MRSAEAAVPHARLAGLLGVLLLGLGAWATLRTLGVPVNPYDEGLLLTHSMLLRDGAVPHRDFYSNYPPGIYMLIGAVWSLTGLTPLALRLIGLVSHVGVALLAGRLAGRMLGTRFEALPAGGVLLWLYPLGTTAYAWLVALLLALVTAELLLVARHATSPVAAFGCGVSFAAVSCFRHDFFVYLALVLGALALAARPAWLTLPRASAFAAGLLVPALLVWLPLVFRAGAPAIAADLLLDQVRYVNPSRWLPLPWSVSLSGAAAVLGFAGPLLALTGAAAADSEARTARLLVGGIGLAALPQMLGRSDLFHLLFAVAPAVTLSLVLLQHVSGRLSRRTLGAGLLVAGSAVVVLAPAAAFAAEGPLPAPWPSGPPPYYGLPVDADRTAALAFVVEHTQRGEPIYVGRSSHSLLLVNEVDFYFFARRPGATRYLQFDPGTVTRDDVQARMVQELEAHGTRLAVLSDCCWWEEPNTSRIAGSSRLDDYFARHFGTVAQFGRYRVLWRREPREPLA